MLLLLLIQLYRSVCINARLSTIRIQRIIACHAIAVVIRALGLMKIIALLVLHHITFSIIRALQRALMDTIKIILQICVQVQIYQSF